jgi:magnesium transporter
MIRTYQFHNTLGMYVTQSLPEEKSWPDKPLWIDVIAPTADEKSFLEKKYSIEIPERSEIEEIEISSRYQEEDNQIYINTYFLLKNGDTLRNENMSFILKKDIIFTVHLDEAIHFRDITKHFTGLHPLRLSSFHIFITLIEMRIDYIADILEHSAREVASLVRSIRTDHSKLTFEKMAMLDENNMVLRENVADKKRILYALLKSELLPTEIYRRIEIMLQDLETLVEYTGYLFERLDNLQATLLGILNSDQNQIIKIFTIMSVTFMPPTLIASLYGMNFQFMPELGWQTGYPFAITLMIISAVVPILIFKKKGWL